MTWARAGRNPLANNLRAFCGAITLPITVLTLGLSTFAGAVGSRLLVRCIQFLWVSRTFLTFFTRQTRKRSFSPNSDDGDLVVPPIEDDDTPPPNAPILRQPVAFSWDNAASAQNITTYEAPAPSRLASATATYFLPGQEVPSSTPPQPRPPRGIRMPKKKKPKTRHYNDDFYDKTSSFRLKGYGNDPDTAHLGTRPHAQMYHAPVTAEPPQATVSSSQSTLDTSSQASRPARTNPAPGIGATGAASSSQLAPHAGSSQPGPSRLTYPVPALAVNAHPATSTLPTGSGSNNAPISFNITSNAQNSASSIARPTSPRAPPARPDPTPSFIHVNPAPTNPSSNTSRTSDQRPAQRAPPTSATNQSHYYRRDYDRDQILYATFHLVTF